MPALSTLLPDMIKANDGFFKVAFSLSGVGMEQLENACTAGIGKLQELRHGCVEFLAKPYSRSLSSLVNEECFASEVATDAEDKVFRQNSADTSQFGLIYSDDIGLQASQLGFRVNLLRG